MVSSTATAMRSSPWPIPSSPTSSSPKVSAFSTALGRSNKWVDRGVRGIDRQASHSAKTPSGTLDRNSQCQDTTDRIAAATDGPAAEQLATTRAVVAMPRPSAERGKMKRTRALLTLMMPAAPSPCATRAATSSGRVSARPQAREDAVNTASPHR